MPPGGQATPGRAYDDYPFGSADICISPGLDRGRSVQLILSISKDKETISISDRGGPIIQMARSEALELMEILNRKFLLDTMKQV